MRNSVLALLFMGVPGLAMSSTNYIVTVSVKDAVSDRQFPSFVLQSLDQVNTVRSGDCKYTGLLSRQSEQVLVLHGKMSCIYEQGSSHMDMPEFSISDEGGSGSIEMGEEGTDMWKYSVDVKVQDL
ncbi:hypothetical protein [Pseudoalteromonas rubra]|uniref:DUF3617 domain-containing protein n=1 Tax=Pseudoalteromonas rubra TaxID=43658 RepID=A0A0F4QIW0_9GAMM|nr:hypothetical protein [Pseudoalteromonas rubra]KJZ06592.1 hypothetical protein TW77_19065 [Pseudoalteromonas rubra]